MIKFKPSAEGRRDLARMRQRLETDRDEIVIAQSLALLDTFQKAADIGYTRVFVATPGGRQMEINVGSVGL